MPWKETGRVFERTQFIENYLSGCFTIRELSSRYNVSRKTLYKWIARHDQSGLAGLKDQSRAPMMCPHRTEETIEEAIIAFRKRFPFMGPKKIIARLSELEPDIDWPAPSTAGEILDRRGLIERRERRRPPVHPSRMPATPKAPNDVMTIDYKGHFRLGNHEYCYPLTIVDGFSRYILACEALTSTRYEGTRKVMERVFREFCLPRRILSDNGAPFASPGLAGLSQLSLWWVRIGIGIERIDPGCPQQNGSHERMHRTLKKQTTDRRRTTRSGSNGSLTHSYRSSTKNDRMSRCANDVRRPSTRHHRGPIRSGCRGSSTTGTWKRASSQTPA